VPHESYDPAIEELAARFERAELLIAGILGGVAARATPAQLREAAAQVAAVLQALLEATARWIEENVPEMYREGMREAARSMALELPGEALERMARQETHGIILRSLAEDLLSQVAASTQNVSEDAKRRLRDIQRRQLQKAMARTNPMARVPDFRAEAEEHAIAFTDRRGRRWGMRSYAEMLLRTHSAVILNAGSLNAAIELGSPGVKVSDGGPGDVDEPCRRANGQTWSLAYALTHVIEHPQCRRAFAPLPRGWRGTLDRGAEGERLEVAA
jgi:hypothetical protein